VVNRRDQGWIKGICGRRAGVSKAHTNRKLAAVVTKRELSGSPSVEGFILVGLLGKREVWGRSG